MATLFQRNRKLIIARDEFCAICGRYVDKSLKTPDPMSAEVDHKIPKSKGGKDTIDNLQLVHRICNQKKSDHIGYTIKKEKEKNRFEQPVIF